MRNENSKTARMLLENAGIDPESVIGERQKEDPAGAFPGEEKPVRKGSFKLSKRALDMWREEGGIENPEEMLFRAEREYISKIPNEKLPEVWGAENMADAQDVIAGNPKKAMQMFLKNIGKIAPKLGGAVRKNPDNVPLWFYATILRVSGREMADVILRKWFMTKSESHEPRTMSDIIEAKTKNASSLSESRVPAGHPWGGIASSFNMDMKDLEKAAEKFGIDLGEKPKMWWGFAEAADKKGFAAFVAKMNSDMDKKAVMDELKGLMER